MDQAREDFEQRIPERIAADPAKARAVDAVLVVTVTGEGGGTWTLDLKGDPKVYEGAADSADCTIEVAVGDWAAIRADPNAAMQLYFQGRLKVTGNPMLATKLQSLLG